MLLRRTPARVEREKEVDGVVTPDNIEKLVSKHDKTIGADGEEEFGGQFGALAIMVFSHAVVYGLYLALEGGTSPLPAIGQETFSEYAAWSELRMPSVRDDARCAEKYGADWDAYTQRVPYVFVPGLV